MELQSGKVLTSGLKINIYIYIYWLPFSSTLLAEK